MLRNHPFFLHSSSAPVQSSSEPAHSSMFPALEEMLRGAKRGRDDDDGGPSPRKRRKPYLTQKYPGFGEDVDVPDDPLPNLNLPREWIQKLYKKPWYLVVPGHDYQEVDIEEIAWLKSEMGDEIEGWDLVFPHRKQVDKTSDQYMRRIRPVSREKQPEAQDNQTVAADTDVVMTDSSSAISNPDVAMTESSSAASPPSPQVADSSSSQSVSASVTAAVEPAAPQDAPSQTVSSKKQGPVKTIPRSPIVAIDETAPQRPPQEGPDKRDRIPSERKWRKPGPSSLSQVVTLDVPIPAPDCKARFHNPRFWTNYLEPGEMPDGTWAPRPKHWRPYSPNYRPRPSHRADLDHPDWTSDRPRPPHKAVPKQERDLRVAARLLPQLLKRRAMRRARTFDLATLWRTHAPEFHYVLLQACMDLNNKFSPTPRPKYDCEAPRPVPSKGTPRGAPLPSRPKLRRPKRKYGRRQVTVTMDWDRI
ncbi:hypothetical protein L226DRAFT_575371 [Lentinus tigrinus ALCF2SS1-7]|uniref:Uncharacterized protein n=1 Tax=Lentinus tigrinus ALCF2SS1-6 TaxID=1328759 RepID=A0A5C2RTP1_9APHY|nr:hypothetical protein L227DRAFT_332636 [Lentinus tigrinus ALCF2SS1-6]RPD69715.1 hypothetical protein L226DRAFT_575371 [Lentinus tigrinus ALCF2SS1-7]